MGNVWNTKELLSEVEHEVGVLRKFLGIGKQLLNAIHIFLCLIG